MDRNSSGWHQSASTKDGRGRFRRAVRPREVRARALARQRGARSLGGKSRKRPRHASETSQTFGLPSSSYHLAPLSNLLAGHQIWVRRFPQERPCFAAGSQRPCFAAGSRAARWEAGYTLTLQSAATRNPRLRGRTLRRSLMTSSRLSVADVAGVVPRIAARAVFFCRLSRARETSLRYLHTWRTRCVLRDHKKPHVKPFVMVLLALRAPHTQRASPRRWQGCRPERAS